VSSVHSVVKRVFHEGVRNADLSRDCGKDTEKDKTEESANYGGYSRINLLTAGFNSVSSVHSVVKMYFSVSSVHSVVKMDFSVSSVFSVVKMYFS